MVCGSALQFAEQDSREVAPQVRVWVIRGQASPEIIPISFVATPVGERKDGGLVKQIRSGFGAP
jgi:hypothetical protein